MNADPSSDPRSNFAAPPPTPVLAAGAVSVVLGLIATGFGFAVAVAAATGRSFPGLSSPATAIAFLVFGGVFSFAGWSLAKGRPWGRGVVVLFCLILLPIAYGAITDSQQPLIGYPLGAAALANLVCLFLPSALRWAQDSHML